jgi:D-amino peptidase
MKVVISADMEGTCGVSSWVHVSPPENGGTGATNQTEYNRARQRMTQEVNAAIEGAFASGADEVIVNDSHDGMRNLIGDDLDPRASYISGNDKPLGMVQGVDLGDVGALLYTGYHAKAGTPNGPLAHTWTGWIHDVRFDGVSTGEFGINAAVAGHFGVPVVFVAGDNLAVDQTVSFVGSQCVGVAVKTGLSSTAAIHLHPKRAQELIREGAERAVAGASAAKPYLLPGYATVELDFDHQSRADGAAKCPGVERIGERSIAFQPADGRELIRLFQVVVKLASVQLTP